MFKQIFLSLRGSFIKILAEYQQAKVEYGVQIVTMKNLNNLPSEFIEKREALLEKYSDDLKAGKENFQQLSSEEEVSVVLEATKVFSAIETHEDFGVFLELISWLPNLAYKEVLHEVLSEHLNHLKDLIKKTPTVPDMTLDMDEGCVFSASGNPLFGKLLILLVPIPIKDERGIISFQRAKDERRRSELVPQILEDLVF